MPDADLIARFVNDHFVLNSISDRRRYFVLRNLEVFEEFSGAPLETLTDVHLRAWMGELMNSGMAASTVAWKMKMILSYYGWAWEARVIDADTYMRMRAVKKPRGHANHKPRPYSKAEINRLWFELDQRYPYAPPRSQQLFRNGHSRFRGKIRKHATRLQYDAMIELALVCGLRRGEIRALTIADVHWDNKYIVVHGKREDQHEKVREVPYPDSTREAIQAWFRFRAYIVKKPTESLWLSIRGPNPALPLNDNRWDALLHSIGPDWTMHRLRHTCATERLRAGMSLESLRQFLGHADISMTMRYAQLLREDVHKASEAVDADFQAAIGRPRAA